MSKTINVYGVDITKAQVQKQIAMLYAIANTPYGYARDKAYSHWQSQVSCAMYDLLGDLPKYAYAGDRIWIKDVGNALLNDF